MIKLNKCNLDLIYNFPVNLTYTDVMYIYIYTTFRNLCLIVFFSLLIKYIFNFTILVKSHFAFLECPNIEIRYIHILVHGFLAKPSISAKTAVSISNLP